MRTTVDPAAVWVVVPVHNEAAVVADVVAGLRRSYPNVVCVDDGSTDDSAARIRTTGAHLVRHCLNLGAGAALQTGVEYARARPGARWFVTFDADGQHQVGSVAPMLERVARDEADIVLGSRFLDPATAAAVPWSRRRALRAISLLSPGGRRLGLTDTHNGLRAFNRRVADELQLTCPGMAHGSEFLSLIELHRWRVVEQPVHILYTDYSRTKGQSLINGVNIVTDVSLRRRPEPIRSGRS